VRILLDTVPFLWAVTGAPDLSDDARELFVDPENEVYLSSVSTLEIAERKRINAMLLSLCGDKSHRRLRKRQLTPRMFDDEEATLHLSRLPVLHKDPFDRMLVCQAIVHQLVILTPDELINQYPVRTGGNLSCNMVFGWRINRCGLIHRSLLRNGNSWSSQSPSFPHAFSGNPGENSDWTPDRNIRG